MGSDSMSERAAMMRESLQKGQTITDNVVTILGSFDHRLSAVETAMRPTQVTFLFFFLFDPTKQNQTLSKLVKTMFFDYPFTLLSKLKRFNPSFTDYNNGVHTVKHSERSYKLKEKRKEVRERRRKILMNDYITVHYCDVKYLYTQGSTTESSEIPELTGLIRKIAERN